MVRTLTLLDANGVTQIPGRLNIFNENISFSQGDGNALRIITQQGYVDVGPQNSSYCHFTTESPKFYFNKPVYVAGELFAGANYNQKVWHAGNDGTGSGLDADLLDGKHGDRYIYSTTNNDTGTSNWSTLTDYTRSSFVRDDNNSTGAGGLGIYVSHISTNYGFFLGTGYNSNDGLLYKHKSNGTWGTAWTILSSNNYSTFLDSRYYTEKEADSRFINATGDTMTGTITFNMSNLNPVFYLYENGTYRGAYGWLNSQGTYMFNSNGAHYLGILNNGNPHFDTYNLYHENNAGGFYTWSKNTRNSYQEWDLTNTTTYNVNTYYPVTIPSATTEMTHHEIQVALNSGTKPSWSTHANGYSVRLVWEENGTAWGTIPIVRKIISATYSFANQSPIGGIMQLTYSSTCVLWLRGGGKYFYFSNGQRIKGGPYTTQQTINSQTFTTRTLDEAKQGWHEISTGWTGLEKQFIYEPNIANLINLYGNTNTGASIYFSWNGRSKDVSTPTSRIVESASGRLSIYPKLAVGSIVGVHDSYALSATSFYSSGNLTVNGVSTLSGTVNTNAINCTSLTSTGSLKGSGLAVGSIELSTSTPFIDFHYGSSTADYTSRIIANSASGLTITNNWHVGGSVFCSGAVNSANGLMVSQSGGTGIGISLYGASSSSVSYPSYGLMFAYTSTYEKFGTVTGDWATYFTMDGSDNRGWIFRNKRALKASISCYGDIYAARNIVGQGEVTAYSTSDIRLKKNIKPINNPFVILKRSQPVLFEWNEKAFEFNKEKEKGIVPGLIAQWEQTVLPIAIHTMYEEYLGINYENYIPYLIAGINEHEDEIQRLKSKVRELEDKLTKYVA